MDATLTNRDMVVYALYSLGGATKRFHTEDIALKCFEVWPSAFSWTKYPEYPDKDIVRVALTDARKEKFGFLVDGRTGQTRGQANRTKRRRTGDGLTWAVEWINRQGCREMTNSLIPALVSIGVKPLRVLLYH